MKVRENVRFDAHFANKIDANTLNCVDCFKLAAAQHLAGMFPEVTTAMVPQQQSKPVMEAPPALFVQVYNIHREKRFNDEMEWEIAVNIAYMTHDRNAESEQIDVSMQIMDAIESIPPLEGMEYPYTIYVADSKTVDGIVNITGVVSVWERRTEDAPLIEFADVNVYLKRKDEA